MDPATAATSADLLKLLPDAAMALAVLVTVIIFLRELKTVRELFISALRDIMQDCEKRGDKICERLESLEKTQQQVAAELRHLAERDYNRKS